MIRKEGEMGHAINAIILKGSYDQQKAAQYDLIGVELGFDLTMFFISGFYSAYWQKKLGVTGFLETNCPEADWYPSENVLFELMKRISQTEPILFAVIMTDYFGGTGEQFANVYKDGINVDLGINTINKALHFLGVQRGTHRDAFDAAGLGEYRSNPDYLDKYIDLALESGA